MPTRPVERRKEGSVARRRRKVACRGGPDRRFGVGGTGGAHQEHVAHVCDTGGVPAGYVRVEVPQVIEDPAHVGDGRDVPADDGSIRRNGGGRVSVERLNRRLQGGLVYECGRAGPRTPA
eukprot:scaffold26514_cov53-Phaeocystis_antarctica.AAC.4